MLQRVLFAVFLIPFALVAQAAELTSDQKAALEKQVAVIKAWGTDPKVVDAVKAQNADMPADHKAMEQKKWEELSVLDPFVKKFATNALAEYLKSKKGDTISEIFVSDKTGMKVAFLAKTSNWSHHGKPKHDVPMLGKVWTGKPEVDQSTGVSQIQVGVPVLDGSTAIGSIVVGFTVSKLK